MVNEKGVAIICNNCTAWHREKESMFVGNCRRYGIETQSFEYCDTFDDGKTLTEKLINERQELNPNNIKPPISKPLSL